MSNQYILDVKNMTLDGKPLVINEEYYNLMYNIFSKIFGAENQPKKNIKSPVIPMINYNLFNTIGDILSPFYSKGNEEPKKHNEKSDINIVKLISSEIMVRKYIDFYFMDSSQLESIKNDPNNELNQPYKDKYTKNTTQGSNKPFMNIILISNPRSGNKNKMNDELMLLQPLPPLISIYLYISDNFETDKLKIINNTKKLYKLFDSGLYMPFSTDGETIDYNIVDLNNLKCPDCPKCKDCPNCPDCPKCKDCPKCPDCPKCKDCPKCPTCDVCTDTKPYTYGLYGCAALIFILLIFLFYNIMKSNKEPVK
jgi:hypothetical protein